jgi:hypothetical protein
MVGSALATLLSVARHTEAGMIASSFLNEDGGGRQFTATFLTSGPRKASFFRLESWTGPTTTCRSAAPVTGRFRPVEAARSSHMETLQYS